MKIVQTIKNYINAEQQKKAGKKHGREIAKEEENRHKLGSLLLNEIQRKKEEINDPDNCHKCRRTRRSKCKEHQRMARALDDLAGDIAQKYLEMEPKYLENDDTSTPSQEA